MREVVRSIEGVARALGRYLARRQGSGGDPMRRVTFPCPLCLEVGRITTLVAELEAAPPLLIVVDLQGACAHAVAFGALEQILGEAWTLTEAALEAAEGLDC
jgi:hypothetical protein